jgi:hypothetical protein
MHRNSAGFLAIPFAGYAALGAALAIGLLGLWGYVEKQRYDALRHEYDAFKGGVEALGLAAKKAAAEKEAQDKLRKEQADAENKRSTDALLADISRLRAQRAGRSIVPPSPGASKCPDGQACFERAELERSLRDYRSSIRGLVDEGSAVTVDLDTVRRWAQQR